MGPQNDSHWIRSPSPLPSPSPSPSNQLTSRKPELAHITVSRQSPIFRASDTWASPPPTRQNSHSHLGVSCIIHPHWWQRQRQRQRQRQHPRPHCWGIFKVFLLTLDSATRQLVVVVVAAAAVLVVVLYCSGGSGGHPNQSGWKAAPKACATKESQTTFTFKLKPAK